MAKANDKPRVIIKRKKGGHGGHHGGAWKVAYADFVTAMMALFMVLWLLTQADMKLRSQIAQYFRNPGVLPGGSVISQEANAQKSRDPQVVSKDILIVQSRADQGLPESGENKRLAEQKQFEVQAKAIEEAVQQAASQTPELAALKDEVIIEVNDAGLSIQVVDKGRNMLFDLSSAELKPPLIVLLKKMSAILGRLPNHIEIGGHTDSRPYPTQSTKTNWELSFERANNARRILESNGMRAGQITRVLAYADSNPLVPDNPMADENRRLSILAEREIPLPARADGKPGNGVIVLPPDAVPTG
ncbi:MAG TPA: flagellar motor protein MotB [Candidatus Bathyarchaeia archaeon]|nr:flagellar motor protein MotB [Candidatus Bathyarchaeia archaeon]